MRFVILFAVLFLATMIAFAFVGNALFRPGENDTASPTPEVQPPGTTLAPSTSDESWDKPVSIDRPPSLVRFVSTADDPVAEDQDGPTAANNENGSAVASPSDLQLDPTVDEVDPSASVPRKQAAAEGRSQVQRRQNCRPTKRRVHRCRLRR